MTYGLIVKNSGNFIQIDDNYRNAVLLAEGSAYFPGSEAGFMKVYFPGSITGYNPIVFIRYLGAFQTYLILGYCTLNYFEVRLEYWWDYLKERYPSYYPNGSGYFNYLAKTGWFEYKVFGYKSALAVDGTGMVVKNANNDVVFSSAEKYSRIHTILDTTIPSAANDNLAKKTITYSSNTNDFVCAAFGTVGFNGQMGDSVGLYGGFRNVSPGVIEVAQFYSFRFAGTPSAHLVTKT